MMSLHLQRVIASDFSQECQVFREGYVWVGCSTLHCGWNLMKSYSYVGANLTLSTAYNDLVIREIPGSGLSSRVIR